MLSGKLKLITEMLNFHLGESCQILLACICLHMQMISFKQWLSAPSYKLTLQKWLHCTTVKYLHSFSNHLATEMQLATLFFCSHRNWLAYPSQIYSFTLNLLFGFYYFKLRNYIISQLLLTMVSSAHQPSRSVKTV